MTRRVLAAILIVVAMLAAGPANSQSSWEGPGDQDRRIGLWVGTSDRGAALVGDDVEAKIDEEGGIVVRRGGLEVPEATSRTQILETLRNEGRETFFFDDVEVARQWLETRVGPRLETTRPWLGCEETSANLFEAGVFLVRAHLEGGDRARARESMRRLVAVFPAHRPDRREVPPDVVELWEEATVGDGDRQARLDVSEVCAEDRDCEIQVNGAVVGAKTIDVAPERSYLVARHEPDSGRRYLRWIVAEAGETRRVVVPDDSTSARRLGEAIEEWRRRADLDEVVYVGPGDCGGDDETQCVGVYGGERSDEGNRWGPFDRQVLKDVLER